MRNASLPMIVFVVLSCAAAVAQTAEPGRPTPAIPNALKEMAPPQADNSWRATCFTMRSYLFARNDGEAPRPVGMTTCTPGSRFRMYHAGQKAQFGLFPAGVQPLGSPSHADEAIGGYAARYR